MMLKIQTLVMHSEGLLRTSTFISGLNYIHNPAGLLLLLILMMWLIGKRAQVQQKASHTLNIKCIFNRTCPMPPKID